MDVSNPRLSLPFDSSNTSLLDNNGSICTVHVLLIIQWNLYIMGISGLVSFVYV